MNPFEMVVAIVFLVTIGRVLQARYRHGVPAPDAEAGEAIRAREEIRALKERIQVLERVVTDNHGSRDLDAEIERLRDR